MPIMSKNITEAAKLPHAELIKHIRKIISAIAASKSSETARTKESIRYISPMAVFDEDTSKSDISSKSAKSNSKLNKDSESKLPGNHAADSLSANNRKLESKDSDIGTPIKSKTDLVIQLSNLGRDISFSELSPKEILETLSAYSFAGCICIPLFRRACLHLKNLELMEARKIHQGLSDEKKLFTSLQTICESEMPYYLNFFTAQDRVKFLDALARQRARMLVPAQATNMFQNLKIINDRNSQRDLNEANSQNKSDSESDSSTLNTDIESKSLSVLTLDEVLSVWSSLNFLRIPIPPEIREKVITEGVVSSSSANQIVNILYQFCLSEHVLAGLDSEIQPSQNRVIHLNDVLSLTLPTLAEKLSQKSQNLTSLSLYRCSVVRQLLRYVYPNEFTSYVHSQPVIKDVLRTAYESYRDLQESGSVGGPSSQPSTSLTRFVSSVSWCLTKLKIGHFTLARRGPFHLDVLERDRKIVYRCLKQDQWMSESLRHVIGPKLVEECVLTAMGYKVVNIPWWHWNKLKVRKTRIEYIRMSRYLAVMDPRKAVLNHNTTSDLSRGEGNTYVGEYQFAKEAPIAYWAWGKPKEPRPQIGTKFTEPFMSQPVQAFKGL